MFTNPVTTEETTKGATGSVIAGRKGLLQKAESRGKKDST